MDERDRRYLAGLLALLLLLLLCFAQQLQLAEMQEQLDALIWERGAGR
ncbi:MAG: hypothetical protein VYA51_12885 [Planctomycetota bacterium]|nr:hypothetical protein [Planctomycetota bacterium]